MALLSEVREAMPPPERATEASLLRLLYRLLPGDEDLLFDALLALSGDAACKVLASTAALVAFAQAVLENPDAGPHEWEKRVSEVKVTRATEEASHSFAFSREG